MIFKLFDNNMKPFSSMCIVTDLLDISELVLLDFFRTAPILYISNIKKLALFPFPFIFIPLFAIMFLYFAIVTQ